MTSCEGNTDSGCSANSATTIRTRKLLKIFLPALLFSVSTGLWAQLATGQISVLTQHYDNARTGQNTNETILTPVNVNPTQFGKLFTQQVDGQVYTQPLYLANVKIPNSGTHNVVYVATEGDSVYAFDADSNGGTNASPLWYDSMLSPAFGAAAGATTILSTHLTADMNPQFGITGTPVIDPSTGTLYVVSATDENGVFPIRLHALDVATGAEKFGGPVTISPTIAGTGNGSTGGQLSFDSRWENQRAGLLLLNGVLYIPFASHGDNGPWHGYVLSFNPKTLQLINAFCTTPNGTGAGIWMSGTGLAAEVADPVNKPFGRMFFATGNGDFNATTPVENGMSFGDSILNLDLSGGVGTVLDAFTPSNQAALNSMDGDVGSGGVVLLPDQGATAAHRHLLVQVSKQNTIYLLDRDNLGGYNPQDKAVQEIISVATPTSPGQGVWGGPAYWNNHVYIGAEMSALKAYTLTAGLLSTTPSSETPQVFGYPGPSPIISANGATNGIVWAVQGDQFNTVGPATLWAYDATNLANVLYSSNTNSTRDYAGTALKFAVPTVANGKVYVGGTGATRFGGVLNVYGLLNSPTAATPTITPGSESFTTPLQVTITDTTPNAIIYYTTDGTAPTTSSTLYSGPIGVSTTETINAIASAAGFVQSNTASATYTLATETARRSSPSQPELMRLARHFPLPTQRWRRDLLHHQRHDPDDCFHEVCCSDRAAFLRNSQSNRDSAGIHIERSD